MSEHMTQITEIPVGDIAGHPRNPRRRVGDVTGLADSIRQVGVLEPLVVVHAPTGGVPYRLIAGHRRHAAALTACLATVPCIVRDDLDDPAAQLAAAISENIHREGLSPVEEGDAYQALLEFPGWGIRRVAKAVARGQSTVRGRLAIAGLPELAREKVHAGQVTIDEAAALAEFADDPAALAALTRAAGGRDWGVTLAAHRRDRDRRKAAAEELAALERDGVTVVRERDGVQGGYLDCDGPPRTAWSLDLGRVLGGAYLSATPGQVAGHASCPGHAALYPDGPDVRWLCLRPDLHTPPDPGPEAPPQDARIPAGDPTADGDDGAPGPVPQAATGPHRPAQAEAEDEASCEDAYQVRADHILRIASGTGPLPHAQAAAIARGLIGYLADRRVGDDGHSWIGWVDPDIDLDEIYDEARAREAARLASERDPHRVLLAIVADEAESWLRRAMMWGPQQLRDSLPWLDLLAGLGWEPCTWEQQRIDAARQADGV